jgi:hypothetical protein
MKTLTCTLLFLGLTCCKSIKSLSSTSSGYSTKKDTLNCKNNYLIKSIYLNDSTYIIHAFKNDTLFKIVSPLNEPLYLPPMLKGDKKPCEELKEGNCYPLEIHSLFEVSGRKADSDSGYTKIDSFGPHRGTLLYNGSSITFDKESNYELYYCVNIKGKCYVKK